MFSVFAAFVPEGDVNIKPIALGLASIAAAVTYTGGPWPFGYRGLGEVFVFAFFGVVAWIAIINTSGCRSSA